MPNSDYLYDSQSFVKNDTKMIEENGKYYVYTVASHSNVPINDRLYEKREFKLQVDSYLFPYNKPVLLYHDSGTDNIGNVVWAKYFDIQDNDEAENITGMQLKHPPEQDGFILLKLKVKNEEQQRKIEDGLYNTVSIGFFSEYMECSICGEKIESMWDIHEHEPGKEYEGETCYYLPRNIEFVEVSVVNIPADRYAIILNKEYEQANSYVENKDSEVVLTDSINSKINMISRQKKKNNISHIDFSGSYSKKPVETYPKDRAESVNYNNDNKVDGGVPMDKITMDSLDDGIKGKINEIKELKDENVKLKDEIEKMKPFIDYVSKLKEREKNEKIEKIVDLRITLGLLDNANKDKYVEKISKWDDERLDETMNDLVALAEKTIKEEKEEINSNEKDKNEDSEVTEKEVVDEETEDPKEDSTEDSEEVNSEESEDNDDNEDVNSNGEDGIKKLDKTEGIENKDEQEIVVKTKQERLKEILNLD